MAEDVAAEQGADIRHKALIRLGVAAAVTAVALAGLWWLDRGGQAPKPRSEPVASSVTIAPPPLAPPPEAPEPSPEAMPTPEASVAEPVPPPPPQVGGIRRASPGTPAAAPRPTPVTARPGKAAAAPSPAGPPVPTAAPPLDGGFSVQLGVFKNAANAQELVERLQKQGIRAYAETRVHVGPFLNRDEADKARAELKRLGLDGLISRTVTSQ